MDYIHRGDIFQANITLRAEAEFAGDPLDAFCQGVTALDPPYAAFIGVSAPGAARPGPASPDLGRGAVVSGRHQPSHGMDEPTFRRLGIHQRLLDPVAEFLLAPR